MKLEDLADAFAELVADKLAKRLAGQLGSRGGDKPFTVEEAAKELKVSDKTIRRRIEAGEIARIPNMGRVLIPASEIERLKAGQPAAKPPTPAHVS